ncbi:MAG TPA: hypothetical protein VG291_05365 [Xanthobacteraceae bacterium]|nr:hypothetical protein [Xanthobacteraceae bacterium]
MSNVAGKPNLPRVSKAPRRLAAIVTLGASIAAFAAGAPGLAQISAPPSEPAASKIPALASAKFAWLALGVDWLDPPPGLGRGPIRPDPAHPLHGNRDGPGQVTPHIGNAQDPVLKPWAARQMQESNDEVLSGKRGLPFSAQSTCYPGGVPEQLLTPAEPLYFVQTPRQVWMIWQTDHLVRRIYLTDQHSETVRPSWFGESIGHYEGGDTLVIDTIGLQAHNSYLDWFRTPHTEKLHVSERLKLSADGTALEALVRVEDPDTFNEPLNMVRRWRKVPNPLYEMVCGENNRDYFGMNLFPIPHADTPDF